jgi:very-short-patch-repair endonuclease
VTETPDERCAAIAAGQFGIIGADQTLEAGLSMEARYRRIRAGRLLTVFPGAYRWPGAVPSWEGTLLAALIATGPRSVASHRSAAALYGLEGIPRSVAEISLPSGRRLPGVVTHRLRPGDEPAERFIGPFSLTTPERTLLDLSGVLPARQVGLAIDDALRRKMTTLGRLQHQLESVQARGRNGVARFRRLLGVRDDRDGKLRSTFEAKMLRVAKRVDDSVKVDHHVAYGSHDYFMDLAYPQARLGIECHSMRWHFGERANHDVVRDRHLKLLGWTVIYFSWDDIECDPKMVEDHIRRILTQLSDPRALRLP